MSVIIKSFMGIFFFALVVFLGTGIINYQAEANRASGYKHDVVQQLQDSNFAPSVINACIQAGARQNYNVSIDVSVRDGSHHIFTQHTPATHTADVVTAYVTVEYTSRLPFLGVETPNVLRGFAR